MAYIYDLADTWNASGTTFTGIKLNVTDTASAASSLLMDLQVNGVRRFRITKNQTVILGSGAYADTTTLAFNNYHGDVLGGTPSTHITGSYGEIDLTIGGQGSYRFGGSSIVIKGIAPISWSSALYGIGTADLFLYREAANTLAQRNGTAAQAFHIYNTYTSDTIYERGVMKWVSNTLRIGTEKLGTGLPRNLALQTDGITRLFFQQGGPAEFTVAGGIYINGQVGIAPVSAGVMRLINYNADGFSTLQLGLATTGFPALKVSTSTLQVRLGNDSAFTNIQGKLTTETNAVAETITATHTITLYDAAGTAYKVPCVAV